MVWKRAGHPPIAGHVSTKLIAHYSHARLAAKRAALDMLAGPRLAGSNADTEQDGEITNHVTNGTNPQNAPPHVVEKDGRPVRTRTADLYRVNFEVQQLNPFACLAFPCLPIAKSLQNSLVLVTNW
jgi:hypothetical protein